MNYCKKYQTTPIQQDKFKCLTKKCILFPFYGVRTVLGKERKKEFQNIQRNFE